MNNFNLPPSKDNDCYFYVYSTCSKGATCPFRHEPASLTNETVCTYWKSGNCSRPKCIFRHFDVGSKKRNVMECYWESQPGGCRKPHCPFLHDKPKDPVTQPLPTATALDSGTIIINKNKLKSLQKILSVTSVKNSQEEGPRRVVVPPGSGILARQTITGGIKNRLGKGDVKSRLGFKEDQSRSDGNEETVEVVEEEYNSEEERLRRFAIKSLDLRSRIDHKDEKKVRVSESDSDVDIWIENKKIKKEKKLKKKKEKERIKEGRVKKSKKKLKKEVKRSRHGSGKKSRKELPLEDLVDLEELKSAVVNSRRPRDYLPSASDYSDLESPVSSPGAVLASIISKTDQAGTLQSDLATVSKNSAKQRLGRRGESREEEREVRLTKTIRKTVSKPNQTYASKILGGLLGGVSDRLGTREREISDNVRDRRERRLSEERRSESRERKSVKSEVKIYGVMERLGKKTVDSMDKKRRKSGGITVCLDNKKDKEGDFPTRRKVSVSEDESSPEKRVSKRKVSRSEDESLPEKRASRRKVCQSDDETPLKIKVKRPKYSESTVDHGSNEKGEQNDPKPEGKEEYAPVGGRKLKLKNKKQKRESPVKRGKDLVTKKQKPSSLNERTFSESFNLDDSLDVNGSQETQDDDVMQQLDDFINE